jgi:hypothetical protein
LAWQFCSGSPVQCPVQSFSLSPVQLVMFCLSRSGCLFQQVTFNLPVQFSLFRSRCTVLAVLSLLSSPSFSVFAILSGLPCPGSPVLQSYSSSPFEACLPGSHVLAVLSLRSCPVWQSCPACPVPTVLFCLP